MPAMPLAHVSWALPDNALRPACDAFFRDVFGAETAFEMLVTPETDHMGLDREERLMLIGDTMLIPIAPAGRGTAPDSPMGNMLRRSAAPDRWIGVSLRVADLRAAADWFAARGFSLHFDPGMEDHYFLIGRWQALGMRVEIMQGELPGDLRLTDNWNPGRWATDHPLGIEGLQSIGVTAPSLDTATQIFAERFDWPEIARFTREAEHADCAAFLMGDTVIEAMVPRTENSALAQHLRDVQGICCLTFKVRSAAGAASHLRAQGFDLIGDVATRFAIAPQQAHGRTIWFTDAAPPGYPQPRSRLRQPAEFPPASASTG